MKGRLAVAALVVVGAIFVVAGPSTADHRHRRGSVEVFIGGPPMVVAPPLYWYPPRPYIVYQAPPVVYQAPRPVVVPPPVVYQPPAAPVVWYYCQSYGAYYPNVPSCPEDWVAVPGR